MKKFRPTLSVVIPCFNEEHRLGTNLEQVSRYLHKQTYASEIILVDDGSSDETLFLLRKFSKRRQNIHVVEHIRNEGKGAAVKTGILAAAGEYILFLDADMSTPIQTVEQCWGLLRRGTDIVMGSRRHHASRIKSPQPWVRMRLGQGFTWLTNTILGLSLSDVTCGFKVFRRRAAKWLIRAQTRDDWSFDAELLFLARRKRMSIVEVPVEWTDVEGTKVNLLKDIVGSLWGLLAIRLARR